MAYCEFQYVTNARPELDGKKEIRLCTFRYNRSRIVLRYGARWSSLPRMLYVKVSSPVTRGVVLMAYIKCLRKVAR